MDIHEVKTRLSKYINQALKGEEVIIAKGGNPIIKLVPYVQEPQYRTGGQFRGLMEIKEDFDASLQEELLKLFYGE